MDKVILAVVGVVLAVIFAGAALSQALEISMKAGTMLVLGAGGGLAALAAAFKK